MAMMKVACLHLVGLVLSDSYLPGCSLVVYAAGQHETQGIGICRQRLGK